MALIIGVGQPVTSARIQAWDGTDWVNALADVDDGSLVTGQKTLKTIAQKYEFIQGKWGRLYRAYLSGSSTFTAPGTTGVINFAGGITGVAYHVINDATNLAPTIILEGSLDGTNWFEIDRSTVIGSELRMVTNIIIKQIRINVKDLGDATSVTTQMFAVR